MSDKKYFTIVLPLSKAAQNMARQESSRQALRSMLWSQSAERMKALLGKTCTSFTPAVLPAGCNTPLPLGVALRSVEPHEFLLCYYSARDAQESEIRARIQRIKAMGDTLLTKQITGQVEVSVVAVDMSDPALEREMEYANRFTHGDITTANGLYYLGLDQCYVEENVEKELLSHLNEYAVCVAELEV